MDSENKSSELSDEDSELESEVFDGLNINSNNGNELADEDSSTPTICVYGSNGMAGPFDLDVSQNSELPDDSHCECNVSTSTGISSLSVHLFFTGSRSQYLLYFFCFLTWIKEQFETVDNQHNELEGKCTLSKSETNSEHKLCDCVTSNNIWMQISHVMMFSVSHVAFLFLITVTLLFFLFPKEQET